MKKKFKSETGLVTKVTGKVIYCNDAPNICYEASKSCYAGKLAYDIETRLDYIRKRVDEAHESVLEHSNCIYIIRAPKHKLEYDQAEFLAAAKYIHVKTRTEGKYIYYLLGGSIRGYKNLIRNVYNQTNKLLVFLKELIYDSCHKEFFSDLIEAGIMDYNSFVGSGNLVVHYGNEGTFDDKTGFMDYRNRYAKEDKDDLIEIINIDPIEKICKEVGYYGFSLMDILPMCTVTAKFKNMSRVITQQLTRHRNGITQESQRYVDSTGIDINTPAKFKPEKYEYDKLYSIELAGNTKEYTLEDIGEMIASIYPQLKAQGLLKEDARYFLPQAVQSSVYMTFTYLSLFQFFVLRLDRAAQAEIRTYATELSNKLIDHDKGFLIEMYEAGNGDDREHSEDYDILDMYVYYTTWPCNFYGSVDNNVLESLSEDVGDPIEAVEAMNKLSTINKDDEELLDFGMSGNIPKAIDKSDKGAEVLFNTYNPKRYEDTRDEEKN